MQQSVEAIFVWGDTILDHCYLARDRVHHPDPPVKLIVLGPVRERIELARRRGWDWAYPRIFAVSAIAHAFFVASSMVTPARRVFGIDSVEKHAVKFIDVQLKKAKEKPAPKGSRDAGAYAGEAGLIGRKDRPRSKIAAAKNVRSMGLLGHLRDMNGGALSTVLSGDIGAGLNAAMSGMRGSTGLADAGGLGGMRTRGTGAGGGGRSLSIGGLGTGGGDRYGDPNGTGLGLDGGSRRRVRLPPKKFDLEGGLTHAEVARVIQRARARIKFCYEKELQADPNLAGKISTRFTIAPTGRVAAISVVESTMASEKVESCVTKVLQSLVFPKPKGGGIVVVMYPFIFESA